MTPFDFVNSITFNKNNLIKEQYEERAYVPFVVNQALSYYNDTILFANQVNLYPTLDNKMQYDYLRHSITKRKRFSKWIKTRNSEDVDAVRRFYKYSWSKAAEAVKCLTEQQLAEIKSRLQQGGVK
jgi:hypothetical protein